MPCLAYSFTEFPLLDSKDMYSGCHIIYSAQDVGSDTSVQTYYFTSDNVPILNEIETEFNVYIQIEPVGEYKLYKLIDDSWVSIPLGAGTLMKYDFDIGFFILCTDVYLFSLPSSGVWELPNSQVPATNWLQLQLQEQKKVNLNLDGLKTQCGLLVVLVLLMVTLKEAVL